MKEIPPLHKMMMIISILTLIGAMIGYFYAPPDKSALFASMITMVMGFLFGKFTNNFKGGGSSTK